MKEFGLNAALKRKLLGDIHANVLRKSLCRKLIEFAAMSKRI